MKTCGQCKWLIKMAMWKSLGKCSIPVPMVVDDIALYNIPINQPADRCQCFSPIQQERKESDGNAA